MYFKEPSGYGEKWNGWYGPSGRKEHKLHLSKSKKYKTLLKNSLTSSAIKKYNRNLFKNLNQLILDAEVNNLHLSDFTISEFHAINFFKSI